MPEDATPTPTTVAEALAELERLHAFEAEVLRSPARAQLDEIAHYKLVLCECLREALGKQNPTPEEIAALRRLRKTAFLNQVLLLHARDTVYGVLELAGAIPKSTSNFSRAASIQEGVRVNFRG